MKPYEHYLEAEKLLGQGNETQSLEVENLTLARAQVHATLALVQARYSSSHINLDEVEHYDWIEGDDLVAVIKPENIKVAMKSSYGPERLM